MKSKIPCPPGLRPEMKFDQATGDCGGVDVVKAWTPSPSAISFRKFGMRSGKRSTTCIKTSGSSPSMPSTTTRRNSSGLAAGAFGIVGGGGSVVVAVDSVSPRTSAAAPSYGSSTTGRGTATMAIASSVAIAG